VISWFGEKPFADVQLVNSLLKMKSIIITPTLQCVQRYTTVNTTTSFTTLLNIMKLSACIHVRSLIRVGTLQSTTNKLMYFILHHLHSIP